METAPAILEIGLVLLAAVGFGWAARRVGLPAVVFVLASTLVATGAIGSPLYVALVSAVAVSIGASAVLVRLVPVPMTGS